MYSLHHAGHNKHQACSSRTPPRDIDFSDVSLKTLLVLVLRSIFHPSHVHLLGGFIAHHCVPQWLSTVFPTSSLPPATFWEQSVCGRPPGQPQRCSALIHEEQMTGPSATTFSFSSASFTMLSTSLSVSLYATHTRTSPPNSIHRHVLQPFALPRRVIAFTSGEQYTSV